MVDSSYDLAKIMYIGQGVYKMSTKVVNLILWIKITRQKLQPMKKVIAESIFFAVKRREVYFSFCCVVQKFLLKK